MANTQDNQSESSGLLGLGCLSPQSVGTVLTANPDLSAVVICQIVDGLIKMLYRHQDRWNDEKQALEARNQSLEDRILLHKKTLATPPEGYILNGNRVQVGIPIREGLSIMAKFIKQLPDGCITCITDQEGFKDMPYIVELQYMPLGNPPQEQYSPCLCSWTEPCREPLTFSESWSNRSKD